MEAFRGLHHLQVLSIGPIVRPCRVEPWASKKQVARETIGHRVHGGASQEIKCGISELRHATSKLICSVKYSKRIRPSALQSTENCLPHISKVLPQPEAIAPDKVLVELVFRIGDNVRQLEGAREISKGTRQAKSMTN